MVTSASSFMLMMLILGGSIHAVRKTHIYFVFASKEIGLEVNADKTKYMFMSRDQSAGRSHNTKIDKSPL